MITHELRKTSAETRGQATGDPRSRKRGGGVQQKSKLEKSQAARETDQAGAGNDNRWMDVSACDITVMGLQLSKEQPGKGFVILVLRTTK